MSCLCNLIPEACRAEGSSPGESIHHSQAELDALLLLARYFPESDVAVEAGLISRWLGKYPFGGPEAPVIRKQQVILQITGSYPPYDSDFGHRMKPIIESVSRSDVLIAELMRSLFGDDSPMRTPEEGRQRDNSGARHTRGWVDATREMIDEQTVAMEWTQQVPNRRDGSSMSENEPLHLGSRPREESIEERILRRRRREAVVVGRDGQSIPSEDIIDRETPFSTQSVEGDVEEMMEINTGVEVNRPWCEWLSRLRPDGLALATT